MSDYLEYLLIFEKKTMTEAIGCRLEIISFNALLIPYILQKLFLKKLISNLEEKKHS